MGGGQNGTPARGQAQPGQMGRYAIAAGHFCIAQTTINRQALRLRWAYGLTEAQANTLAALIWGAGQ